MSQGGPNNVNGSGSAGIETLTGDSGGAVGPDGAFDLDVLGNNMSGISVVGTPGSNLLTLIGIQSSESQRGTIEIATDAEAVALTATDKALVPSNLTPVFAEPPPIGSTTPNTGEFSVLDVDNIRIDGNTISSTDVNGAINLTPNGTGGVVIPTNLTLGETSQDVTYTINGASISSVVAVHTEGATDLGGFTEERHTDIAGFGPHHIYLRTRGSEAVSSVVQDGDALSREISCGYDGTDFSQAAEIRVEVDGTPGNDDMPGRMKFFTSPDGTQVPVLAMTISQDQSIQMEDTLTLALSTEHAIPLFGASGLISEIGPLTNGQVIMGSTGVAPVANTITAGSNITVTNGAGTITIAANGGGELAITALDDTDSPYTVLSTDEYLSCDVSGGILTIDLADAPTTGRVVSVKDSGGDAGTNNITVTTTGGAVTIDGATTYVMNTNYQAAQFIFNGASYEVF